MKKILNFMLYSDTLKKVIDVEYKDNTVVSVVLSPDLTMKFVDDALVFESEESDNSFALADISGFRYTKRAISGIQEVTAETFVVTAESLQINGLPAGTTVRVYDLNGRVVADAQWPTHRSTASSVWRSTGCPVGSMWSTMARCRARLSSLHEGNPSDREL